MKQTGFMTYAAGALAALGLVALAAPGAWAEHVGSHASVNNANATATVISVLTLAKGSSGDELNFGSFTAPTDVIETIVIATNDVRTTPGASNISLVNTIVPKAADFDVTGQDGRNYNISLPASVTLESGANTMLVDTFTDSKSGQGTISGTTDAFSVGATLHVAVDQAVGVYAKTYLMTVNYD